MSRHAFACLILLAAIGSSPSFAVTYDDFTGDELDPLRWQIAGNPTILSMSGGILSAQVTGTPSAARLFSTVRLEGDFEVILDWRDFSSDAVGGVAHVALHVAEDPENYIYIRRMHHAAAPEHVEQIAAGIVTDGVPNISTGHPAPETAGQMRITRTGSTIVAYYDVGSGWIEADTFTDTPTSGLLFAIEFVSGDDGNFTAATDWIDYTGLAVAADRTTFGRVRALYRP